MKNIYSLGVALMLAGSAVVGLTGCAGDRYNQSTGEYIDDKVNFVAREGSADSDALYKYPDVNVTTFKGKVQLSGFVNDASQKSRAATLAKNVQGVNDVVNNISVK